MVDLEPEDRLALEVHEIARGDTHDDYTEITLKTSRGNIEGRYYAVSATDRAVIFVGGAGGGWDTPAQGLYPRLCRELGLFNVAGLRLRYRHPNDLLECALDVLAGLSLLEDEGIERVGLVGHSFGGAVVIQAAASSKLVRTVVTLATQSYGVDPVRRLADNCSIFFIHGQMDEVLSSDCSVYAFALAHQPKHIQLLRNARHGLDEAAEQVHDLALDWLINNLPPTD